MHKAHSSVCTCSINDKGNVYAAFEGKSYNEDAINVNINEYIL